MIVTNFGRYLWRFFVGDNWQLGGLVVTFAIVGVLAHPLGGWDGLLAFALVTAVVWSDVFRRAAAARSASH